MEWHATCAVRADWRVVCGKQWGPHLPRILVPNGCRKDADLRPRVDEETTSRMAVPDEKQRFLLLVAIRDSRYCRVAEAFPRNAHGELHFLALLPNRVW